MENGHYFGSFPTVFDEAGRITAPRKFRDVMDRNDHVTWHVTPGLNGNLYLYNRGQWQRFLDRNRDRYEEMDQKTHQFFSFAYGCSMETKVDRQGRMPIPTQVRGFLGGEREVVLVGTQDRLELWSKTAWDAFCDGMWPKFGIMATDLARKGQEGSDGSEKGEENDGH